MFRTGLMGVSLLVALGACATTPAEPVNEAALAKLETFELTGERTNCLPPSRSTRYTAVTEEKLLVQVGVSQYYLNDVRGRCNGATSGFNRFEFVVFGGQVCNNQIVNIVDNTNGFTVGSCALGDFQELRLKEEDTDE